jgi:hypothetical protein
MVRTTMVDLIRLFTQIAVLRRGPQDVPASALLLAVTVVGYILVNSVVNAVLPPLDGPWLPRLLLDVAFNLVWFALWLSVVRRPERILQTTTAVFGFQAVLAPILIVSEWLAERYQHDQLWQLPFSLVALVLLIWLIAALGHVVKAALEWSGPASVALVILQILVEYLLAVSLSPLKS